MESSWTHAQVFPIPYGGRIVYNINGTPFNIHLKDAQEVEKGKRWSQIMYLYYLFGWKIDACNMTNANGIPLKKENAYLLALDGDVDFEPVDFELVLARMVKNPDVAACCNQIHPSQGLTTTIFDIYFFLLRVFECCELEKKWQRAHGLVSAVRICRRSLVSKSV